MDKSVVKYSSKNQSGSRARTLGFLFSFICSSTLAGEPRRVTVPPGMIELRLESVPAGADVSWEARSPLGLDYRVYEQGTVFVTARATPGNFVVSSDVIDWEGRKRDRTTWIVTIGDKPGPGPGPEPDPEPNPIPPKPIPQGLAGEVYKLAHPINEPEKSLKYAINFEVISSKIGAGVITTVQEARDEIIAINLPLSTGSVPWTKVGTFVAQQISKQPTLADIKVLFDLVAIGLRAAGETK